MSKMMVASSPVEIEAKADEAGLEPPAHDAALRIFHDLTNRLGEAVIALNIPHKTWPHHRFYFGETGGEIGVLLGNLLAQSDMLDVTDRPMDSITETLTDEQGTPSGLFIQAVQGPYHGILVGHEDHQGMLAGAGR